MGKFETGLLLLPLTRAIMNKIGKYSIGVGDRFGHQAEAQLKAILMATELGVEIIPVWNKSYREHSILHSTPQDTRRAADMAVRALNYKGQYFVDADHINLSNVDDFIDYCDFFTIDVAEHIGKHADKHSIEKFIANNKKYLGKLILPESDISFEITREKIAEIAHKYLYAVKEVAKIYRHIVSAKGTDNFVAEVSMDEVNVPQTPMDIFFILSALAAEKVVIQTIAPKFTGQFNKGVDYVGNLAQFAREFEQHVLVIKHAANEFNFPNSLKLSIHSGSDKFSIYKEINRIIKKHQAGLHLKTAGTTWLEEVAGLAIASSDTLEIVKEIYAIALNRFDELCAPYATVINIDRSKLPLIEEVKKWDGEKFANTLRHNPAHPDYNPHFRQLIHVSYKVAFEKSNLFINGLKKYAELVGQQVTDNLLNRHIKPIFL
ncbi:MAG: tagaturonate epimerase family protein [Bacteroidales bacterium]